MFINDRFEIKRDAGNRVSKGWRVTRWISSGAVTIQHLRTGRSKTGIVDNFGNVVDSPREEHFYHPGQTHNGYML